MYRQENNLSATEDETGQEDKPMGNERYQRIGELKQDEWILGAPLEIEKGALLYDTLSRQMILQLRLRNVSRRTIRAAQIAIARLDAQGNSIADQADQAMMYQDLNSEPGSLFGDGKPILLGTAPTRQVKVRVQKAVFGDGSRWESEDSSEVSPGTPLLAELWPKEALEQFDREITDKPHFQNAASHKYLPVMEAAYWVCACAFPNPGSWDSCGRCGLQRDWLFQTADPARLTEKQQAHQTEQTRLTEERKQREAAEQQKRLQEEAELREREAREQAERLALRTRRLQAVKKYGILSALAITIAVVGFLALTRWIPVYRYNEAVRQLDAGNNGEAAVRFRALNDFLDSRNLAQEASYRHALQLRGEGAYEEAAKLFKELETYKDSAVNVQETNYLQAAALLNERKYQAAADQFEQLGNYKDSPAKTVEARYLRAEELFTSGDYLNAYPLYDKLGGHKDSSNKSRIARYEAGVILLGEKKYPEAVAVLGSITGYPRSQQKLEEALVPYVQGLLKEGKLAVARESLNKLKTFSPAVQALQTETAYRLGGELETAGKIKEARDEYLLAGTFQDSPAKVNELTYALAQSLEQSGDLEGALAEYRFRSAYKDSAAKYQNLSFTLAKQYEATGDLVKAAEYYWNAGTGNPEAKEKANTLYLKIARDFDEKEDYAKAAQYYSLGGEADLARKIRKYGDAIKAFQAGNKEDCYDLLYEVVGYDKTYSYKDLVPFRDAIPYFVYCAAEMNSEEYKLPPEQTDYFTFYDESMYYLLQHVEEHADFKDMAKFLEDDFFTWSRIVGRWSSGSNYFKLYFEKDGDPRITYNLPFYTGKYFKILGDVMKFGSDSAGWKNVYRMTLVGENTLKVYSYKADKTYTLYRD